MDVDDLTPVITSYRVSFKTEGGQIGRGLQETPCCSKSRERFVIEIAIKPGSDNKMG